MGFFKDFKDDFSQAVNEMVPGEDSLGTEDELLVDTLEGEPDMEAELSKLDGLLEQVSRQEERKEAEKRESQKETKEENDMSDIFTTTPQPSETAPIGRLMPEEVSDEVSVITQGTLIRGDIVASGSLDVRGQVDGNVSCNGKLTVTGTVNGNSSTSEFYADAAQIVGEVVSSGTVKIGLGSVIVGNVTSSSAVIAGAIKGDIDVQGPVVVDTSAVVMGNIKSRSVQINNGAVIEGFCSQCYADVDVSSLFDSRKGN